MLPITACREHVSRRIESEGLAGAARRRHVAAKFDLLMTLARSLHELGLPSHRLEELMQRMAGRFDTSLQMFSLPTGLMVTVDSGQVPLTAVVRVHAGAACIWSG